MNEYNHLSLQEFRDLLTAGNLLNFRLIYFIFSASVLVFGFILILFQNNVSISRTRTGFDTQLLNILTIVNLTLAAGVCIVTAWLHGFILRSQLVEKAVPLSPYGTGREARCMYKIYIATVIRAAGWEGAALFGLIVCLLGIIEDVFAANPIYWINLMPAAVFLMFAVFTFPTRARLEGVFQKHFGDPYLYAEL